MMGCPFAVVDTARSPRHKSRKEAALPAPYRGLILDFGGVLTTRMRLNGEAFERSEGLRPGAYFHALNKHPDGVAVYSALEVGKATQEDWNRVIGGILGIDPTDLMRRALANLRPEPLIVAAARRARAAGVKVAMLSNSFGIEPYNPYEALGTPRRSRPFLTPCCSASHRPGEDCRQRGQGFRPASPRTTGNAPISGVQAPRSCWTGGLRPADSVRSAGSSTHRASGNERFHLCFVVNRTHPIRCFL
jgi:hypothetical protein